MPPPLVEQERFPAAVHFRARLWVQWGQGVEPDTWQELGAGDGRAVPKGQLQAGGLLRQLQPCSLHSPAEGQGSSPGATRFAPQGRGRLRCRQQGLPRAGTAPGSPGGWGISPVTIRAITGAETCILTPIRSLLMSQIYTHTPIAIIVIVTST